MNNPDRQPRDESIEQAVRNLKVGHDAENSAQLLVTHLRDRLVSYFRRSHFSEADAEDLTQETFRRVFTGIKGLNDAGRFRPWFFQIAQNVKLIDRPQRYCRGALWESEEIVNGQWSFVIFRMRLRRAFQRKSCAKRHTDNK
jgi:hypothetical protein